MKNITVAAHIYLVSSFAQLIADMLEVYCNVNINWNLLRRLKHEEGEKIIGDVPRPIKKEIPIIEQAEIESTKWIHQNLPASLSDLYTRVYQAYLKCETLEAEIVRAADDIAGIMEVVYALHHDGNIDIKGVRDALKSYVNSVWNKVVDNPLLAGVVRNIIYSIEDANSRLLARNGVSFSRMFIEAKDSVNGKKKESETMQRGKAQTILEGYR